MIRYDKFECKFCDKKSFFVISMILHLFIKHKKKITKNDIKFFLRYNIITCTVLNILCIIGIIIKLICFPFWWIYENF